MKELDNTLLGRRLKEARKDAKLTQVEIAGLIGISQANYSYYENGASVISAGLLYKISQITHYSADYLIGLTDKPEKGCVKV